MAQKTISVVGKGFLNYLISNDVSTFKEDVRVVYKSTSLKEKKNVNVVLEY